MEKPARTPEPPYYAVIFSPVRSGEDPIGYQAMAQTMLELAATMPGYLGVEHGEGINGFAMTVSYTCPAETLFSRFKLTLVKRS